MISTSGQCQFELLNRAGRWRTYASVNKAIIGSFNDLLPIRHQAIKWSNADLLLVVRMVSVMKQNMVFSQEYTIENVNVA